MSISGKKICARLRIMKLAGALRNPETLWDLQGDQAGETRDSLEREEGGARSDESYLSREKLVFYC